MFYFNKGSDCKIKVNVQTWASLDSGKLRCLSTALIDILTVKYFFHCAILEVLPVFLSKTEVQKV